MIEGSLEGGTAAGESGRLRPGASEQVGEEKAVRE